MDSFENALPPAGQAEPTLKLPKHYEITRQDRLLLFGTLGICFLAVDAILQSWPHGMGLTATVFAWYALVLAALGPAALRRRENWVLLLMNLALAAAFALGSNPFFHVWNFLALLVLVPIHVCGLSGGAALSWWQPLMLMERLGLLCWSLFGALGASLAALLPEKEPRNSRRVLAIALGSAASLVLVGLLVPVLASADALFAAATAHLRQFVYLHLAEGLWKLILALGLTPFVFSLLYQLRRPASPKPVKAPSVTADTALFLIVLGALCGLYLLFLLVQSAGLFGGAAYLARRGISYAEWARGGFFQMVGVTVINLTVLMTALTVSQRGGRGWAALRLLSTLLTAESLVLLASAAWRMTLYISVYGLSFKRLMTYWGMGMMALFFLIALGKLRKPNRSFCKAALPLALAGWLLINCVPLDTLVAKDQVDRYLAGESTVIDVEYLLYDLSYDTLPQLERLDGGMICHEAWTGYQRRLDTLIAQRRAEARSVCASWASWNLSACFASAKDA